MVAPRGPHAGVRSWPCRAIWDSWDGDGKLDFRGDFYTHTLMTPFFNPGPNPYGHPKVFLAAVGRADDRGRRRGLRRASCATASPPSPTCARSRSRPLETGLAKAGRTTSRLRALPPGVRRHRHDRGGDGRAAADGVRGQIAFYGSTPAYRGVLEHHGWGDLQTELNVLSKQGEWDADGRAHRRRDPRHVRRGGRARPAIAGALLDRFGDLVDRISFYAPYESDRATWLPVVEALKAG